ncbi:AprI/Inh family metalloprotease inhibitor [Ancylobacter pratisalsi]|uniref:AprI/Inh family metalloprotease inhibitor n=1 Tax=Ancylobacter pratisalsi TaxID=1745854 RepID=A0A6P1YKR4_9HYPH|nr:AprI/Inh family metalloprotease inhibitor [Ancylobacter pratisalsi]QIB33296.1 AprI/Inh family metalloprotease inhibitor [Ancylobacter pratisalsi]
MSVSVHRPGPRRSLGPAQARRGVLALLLGTALVAAGGASGSRAQDVSPAEAAAGLAAEYQLTNADGDRTCALQLSAKRRSAGENARGGSPMFDLSFDRHACAAAILFSVDIAAWAPAPGNSILLLRGDGGLVAEFTEGINGTWEALREGDGVYFLVNPRLADAAQTQPEDLFGTWDLARTPGRPACRMRLSDVPMRPKAFRLDPDGNCGLLFGRSSVPDRWYLEQGDLILETATGARLVFARREEGDWSKTPEDNRPLFLSPAP